VLKSAFERFGPVEDVVTFPGRMYAFVNFRTAADAARACEALDDTQVRRIAVCLYVHLSICPFDC
jgi:RNA recognition motif. (a.k.a. RRM, RBD, or RNP domain)